MTLANSDSQNEINNENSLLNVENAISKDEIADININNLENINEVVKNDLEIHNKNIVSEIIQNDEDSLNDFSSPNDCANKAKNGEQLPTYNNFLNKDEIKKQLPPLLEEIDFSKCKSKTLANPKKRRSIRKNAKTIYQQSFPPNKFADKIGTQQRKSTLISNECTKNIQNENKNHLKEGNFLRDIDSEDDQYYGYYDYYDYDYGSTSTNTVIELPPPLEIGMEMPSVPELDIFDFFTFQIPYMANPIDDDSKYIQKIDLSFDTEKLLQEVKSH